MVLERIVGQSLLKKQPDVALFIGFVFTLISFITSYLIFISGISVAMIGFSSLLMLPYIVKIMKPDSPEYTSVFAKDSPTIKFFSFLFIGMALAYAILFGILRPDIRDTVFRTQVDIIERGIAGSFKEAVSGMFGLPQIFFDITFNNLTIVAILLVLSYFYGAGSIFILSYNASIAGVVYGSWINALIWPNPYLWGASSIIYSNWIAYLPHTIIEILAYLLAAIAGLIISKPLTKKNTALIQRESLILIGIAALLIIIGGLVEVTVPSSFS